MKMKHKINGVEYLFRFNLIRIHNPQFSITQTEPIGKEPPKGFPIKLDFSVGTAFSMENKIAKIDVELKCAIENNPKINASLKTIYNFKIENLEDFLVKDDIINIPEYFTVAMVGIALSTTRGIWFEKTSGTLFNNVIFPLVDPSKLAASENKETIKKK